MVASPRAQAHGGGLQLAVVAQLRVSEKMAQDTGSTDSRVQCEGLPTCFLMNELLLDLLVILLSQAWLWLFHEQW